MPKPTQEIKGLVFGQWTVISNELKRHSNRALFYNVKCECGREGWRSASLLRLGKTKSCKSCARTSMHENIFNLSYFNRIEFRAKKCDFEFDITPDYILELFKKQQSKCALSGIKIEFRKDWQNGEQTASLDRIDNTKGYVKGNVQWLHKDINNMKYTFTEEYFKKLCKHVANNTN